MPFAGFKGQEAAVNFLKNSLKKNRLSHAYIFFGPGGVGKMLAALNFAKTLVCKNAVSYEPCGKCPACLKVDRKNHPDVFILKPDKEGGSIKIDEVRQLIKNMYLKPFEAAKKIYIIDEAQEMKHEAANALLKTLEEPPPDAVIILITDNLKSLFHTIVSRCQVVRFFPLKVREVKEILMKEHSIDEVKAHVLSCLSSGRLGEALKYKDEDIFGRRDLVISQVSKASPSGPSFDDVPKEKLTLYLDILLGWFRDILNIKAGADESILINIDKKNLIYEEAKRLTFGYLEGVIDNIVATFGYLDQNANPKLAMSVLAIKIVQRTA